MDLTVAADRLSSREPPAIMPAPRICRITAVCVARDFGFDPAVIMAATRGSPRAAFARQVAMYLAHVGFALSFEAIGRAFGRDRTTVAHACRVIEDGRDDIWLDGRLAALETTCRQSFNETFNDEDEGAIR